MLEIAAGVLIALLVRDAIRLVAQLPVRWIKGHQYRWHVALYRVHLGWVARRT